MVLLSVGYSLVDCSVEGVSSWTGICCGAVVCGLLDYSVEVLVKL